MGGLVSILFFDLEVNFDEAGEIPGVEVFYT